MAVIFDIAAALADCVCTELKRPRPVVDPEALGWVGDCTVHPGSVVAYERCCDEKHGGSQSWVVVLDGQPTVSFPIPDPLGSSSCTDGHTYIQRYEIGALRCVAWGGDDGKPPKNEVKEQDAFNVIGDLTAILTALECCFNDENTASSPCHDREWRLQEYHLVGPEGGCAGAVATIAVEVAAPCCPEESP